MQDPGSKAAGAKFRLLLLVGSQFSAVAYQLLRTPDAPGNQGGFACIPVPATMHFYDASTLRAVRHAQTYENATLGQVVIDQDAMRERKLRLHPFGSAYKILTMKPSTHTDKFGGSSNSLVAEVIGTGVIQVKEVVEKMPFMTVQLSTEQSPPEESCAPEWTELEAAVAEAAQVCSDLDHISSFKGERTRLTERQSGTWSLRECVDHVLDIRDEIPCDRSRLRLTALASTVYLPGELKLEAMERAQCDDVCALASFVSDKLTEEGHRRLALKALSDLSGSSEEDE